MQRLNSQVTPNCVSNIDYHLDQLANLYRESGKKVREGKERSLVEQLLEANPDNASFLTPGSRSHLTKSILSDHTLINRNISSNSIDKYSKLKKKVN